MKCEKCKCRLFISEHKLCHLCSNKVSIEQIQEIRQQANRYIASERVK